MKKTRPPKSVKVRCECVKLPQKPATVLVAVSQEQREPRYVKIGVSEPERKDLVLKVRPLKYCSMAAPQRSSTAETLENDPRGQIPALQVLYGASKPTAVSMGTN